MSDLKGNFALNTTPDDGIKTFRHLHIAQKYPGLLHQTGTMGRYYRFSEYMKERFGCRVHKITVDAGFTCPNIDWTLSDKGCIFCDNRAFSPASRRKKQPVEQQIENGMLRGRKRYKAKKFMAYFQPFSNTHAPVSLLKERYDVVKHFPGIAGISIGTRPDCVDDEKIALIETYTKDYEVWIEYGLQSAHDKTLKIINRNHSCEDFAKAVEFTKNRGIKICAHVIIGLPGETEKEVLDTARECSRLGLDGIKIHPLHVVKGTLLERMFMEGRYVPLELNEYITLAASFLGHLPLGMTIHRITADCPEEILAAPEWINRKHAVIKMLEEYMSENDIRQGGLS